ncbi:indole-3-glycerol phosphate synthase TrpC [Devosia sp. LjRoot3]|uniref:indole-3-glycerol phosphate synthase TrpC n=1 Tax=Devosia sp. LjRoot3 TaxID=3342319 RepID=UPI003ECF5676
MSILDKVRTYKLDEVARAKQNTPLAMLEEAARAAPPTRGFASALSKTSETGFALIAEIKKASPSSGIIRTDFDPEALARAYEAGGATCLSVLTDFPSFQGQPSYLTEARDAVSLPVLRKDFLYDPYQVVEARALGADCVLIIMAGVEDAVAAELEDAAQHWGMDALIEVHDAAELERALNLKSRLVGINNRNLDTLHVDTARSLELASLVPADRQLVSESGLRTRSDLDKMATAGIRRFLVGESLMLQDDLTRATRTLLFGISAP